MLAFLNKLLALFLSFFSLLSAGAKSGGLKYLGFTKNVVFSPISARELAVTDEETAACRAWYDENVRLAGTNGKAPAYAFSVNGVPLCAALSEWSFTVGEESEAGAVRRGGKTTVIALRNEKRGLSARVEATIYEENAACEWTVYLKNDAETDSGVISDFYAMDALLPTGRADVYCSKGSDDAAADFTMLRSLPLWTRLSFAAYHGRATEEFLPYFNLCGRELGAVLGVGWSGQWETTLTAECGGVRARVGQREFLAYLTPGEEARSPLVSLLFYQNENPVKGFNCFRNWVKDCVYPENAPGVQTNMDVLFVSATRTAAEILRDVDALDPAVFTEVDNFWMDAGWYAGCETDWGDGVGNWKTSPDRFPNGIREISEKAASLGCGVVLWYEPERLTNRSFLWSVGKAHDRWLVDLAPDDPKNDVVMWNLAEPDAREYLTAYIAASLLENGVSVYRQDFNFEPQKYWTYADRNYYGGRLGIAENHYITGLYAYLDGLFARIPGLVMDNCASGGRRLDLEMTRRSVPMWRSDYNCDQTRKDLLDATQAHTYGLSFWLPVSGTFANYSTEYAARSSVMPILQIPFGTTKADAASYKAEREMTLKQFYPVECGGTDAKKITAMQYGDETDGMALIFRHKNVKAAGYTFRFSGLEETARYTVTDADGLMSPVTKTGAALMAEGVSLPETDGEKAFLLHYTRAE